MTTTNSTNTDKSTSSMSSALSSPSPTSYLLSLSSTSSTLALKLSTALSSTLDPKHPAPPLPKSLATPPRPQNSSLHATIASAESIFSSLSKIADGGSKASLEMKSLESRREEIDKEADDIASALKLRNLANVGSESLVARRYAKAAEAVRDYREMKCGDRSIELAGAATMKQLEQTERVLQKEVLERYELSVREGDVAGLSELTPLLGILNLAEKGVGLYLRYSKKTLAKMMDEDGLTERERKKQLLQGKQPAQVTVCSKLAKIFNSGVTHLRHHLPMLSYALGEADGDAALVQLVHLEVEKRAVEVIKVYAEEKALAGLDAKAENVISRIEDRYIHGIGLPLEATDDEPSRKQLMEENDCGFAAALGKLADLDASLDEAALCLQHTESYERFIRHAVVEVTKARELRHKQRRKQRAKSAPSSQENDDAKPNDEPLPKIEILPPHTQLNETVAEVGGHYSGLERVLLLASMQRAFLNATYPDDTNFSPVSILSTPAPDAPGSQALQTTIVEECLYAAQRSTKRAFATGHTGTACAAANFCADSLGRVLLEVLVRRADGSTSTLKGLLVGSGGLSQAAMAVMKTAEKGLRTTMKKGGSSGVAGRDFVEDPFEVKRRVQVVIARACAAYNDLEVAVDYAKRLEAQFLEEIDSTYPPGSMTEQLRMCIKSLSPVVESFKNASNRSIDSLVNHILPRVRSIVNDAVGQDGIASGGTFMGTTVMGGSAAASSTVRMNYNLDEKSYELAQVSEGYMGRMCSSLDDLINPLRMHLMPHLSDILVIGALGGAARRLEAAIRRCHFTALGALALDSDIRQFLSYAKERLDNPELTSTVALYKTCTPLARLSQIALLMNVDDLDDVLDLITSSKRKGNWDLKLDDAKAFLNLRVDFEGRKVNELLRISEEE